MSLYFDKFPKILYDIDGKRLSNYQTITDIFFRLQVIRSVLSNFTTYYEHIISDGDTPEILAEKVYGKSEAHWVILLANNIVDAQYDWPLTDTIFNKYIIAKYGSIEVAKTTYDHYEKVISREDSYSGIVTETRFHINQANLTSNLSNTLSSVPYDHYGNLAETQSVSTYNLADNRTVIEIISRDRISNYDHELNLNDAKRVIKIIKPQYYPQIMREFEALTNSSPTYIRRLKY